jgi:hypothetical protein
MGSRASSGRFSAAARERTAGGVPERWARPVATRRTRALDEGGAGVLGDPAEASTSAEGRGPGVATTGGLSASARSELGAVAVGGILAVVAGAVGAAVVAGAP